VPFAIPRLALVCGLMLAAAAPVPPPPPPPPAMITVYHCEESAQTPDGRLIANPEYVSWSHDLGENLRIDMTLNLFPERRLDFAETGFAGHFADHPAFFIEFDSRYNRNTLSHHEVAGSIQIGRYLVRDWMPGNMVLYFDWRMARELLQGTGDARIMLFDTSGAVLQRATMDREIFERVERDLRALYARVRVNQADPDQRCRPTREPIPQEIIISDARLPARSRHPSLAR
jgi:hypothetical protein